MINIPNGKSVPQYDPEIADRYEKPSPLARQSLLAQRTVKVRNSATISDWNFPKGALMLVHGISTQYEHEDGTKLFNQPAQTLFSTWDLISTSLIDGNNVGQFTDVPRASNRRGINVDYVERFTGCYGNVSLILDVPSQNIYGTHAEDIYVDNHAGEGSPEMLADHLKSNIDSTQRPVPGGFSRFVSPTRLLEETRKYNEVLVVGRKGVNIHAGEKATGQLKVLGILSARSRTYVDPEREKQAQLVHEQNIEKLLAVNPGIKVIEV